MDPKNAAVDGVLAVWRHNKPKTGIGTMIASDVVKVNSEDPDTFGYLGGGRVRRDVGDFGSWVHSP